MMTLTRRALLRTGPTVVLAGLAGPRIIGSSIAHSDERQFRHALTLFKDIKYPPDFKHFDYVNPNAPKGGRLRLYGVGSFDSLNLYTYKGDPAGIANENLLDRSLDEPTTEYGLIAEGVWHPDDRSLVVYRLRPDARFHDGTPITPEDVVWSMETLKEVSPTQAFYYKNVAKAEQTGDREVTFIFSEKGNRELPLITGELPVVSKRWWTGKTPGGRPRDIAETTLDIPLNSGPYRIVEVKPGASFLTRRVPDYWGAAVPLNIGQYNFDEIEYVYFRDDSVALEAFKADQYDYRVETSAKNWATAYDTPAVAKKAIVLDKLQTKNPEGMQCWAFNSRRTKFQDSRVRLAFNCVFDFEWANSNLFYGQYVRSVSYFNNSELAWTGLPSPKELTILAPLRNQIPPEVFTTEFVNPVNADAQQRRNNLRKAVKLLGDAGWRIDSNGGNSVLKNDKGETFSVEFLLDQPNFERIALPYKQQLELIGLDIVIRTVDSSQYQRRLQSFDYDVIVGNWPQSLSPGNEQRDFFGSAAADRNGSRNYLGIKNPAVDAIIERLIFSTDRDDLIAASRALDRVLLWNHYVVPMWYIPYDRIARWDRFGRPDKLPDYANGFPSIWWWDEQKAKQVAAAK